MSKSILPDSNQTPLSVGLIAGAFAMLASLSSASINLLDKVSSSGWLILVLVFVGDVLLLTSIVFGGWGIAYGPGRGTANWFALQAAIGIVGLLLLMCAPVVADFNLRSADATKDIAALQRRVAGLQSGLNQVRATDVSRALKWEKRIAAIERRYTVHCLNRRKGKRKCTRPYGSSSLSQYR